MVDLKVRSQDGGLQLQACVSEGSMVLGAAAQEVPVYLNSQLHGQA